MDEFAFSRSNNEHDRPLFWDKHYKVCSNILKNFDKSVLSDNLKKFNDSSSSKKKNSSSAGSKSLKTKQCKKLLNEPNQAKIIEDINSKEAVFKLKSQLGKILNMTQGTWKEIQTRFVKYFSENGLVYQRNENDIFYWIKNDQLLYEWFKVEEISPQDLRLYVEKHIQ